MSEVRSLSNALAYRILCANEACQVRLQELESLHYPTDTPHRLIAFLRQVHNLITTQVRELAKELSSAKDPNALHKPLIRLGQLISRLHEYQLDLAIGHAALVAPATIVLANHLKSRAKTGSFLLEPVSSYNFDYGSIRGSLAKIVQDIAGDSEEEEELQAALKSLGDLAVFRFPHAEKENVLLAVVLAHEVGHAVCERQKIVAPIFDAHSANLIPPGLFTNNEFDEAAYLLDRQQELKAWLEELLCDALAVALIGPAYLFVMVEWLLTDQPFDLAGPTHPSARYRVSVLLKMMDTLGYSSAIEAYRGESEYAFGAAAARLSEIRLLLSRAQPALSESSKLLHDRLSGAEAAIIETAKTASSGFRFEARAIERDLPGLIKLLELSVPPCVDESELPADASAIMNAGCFFLMSGKAYELARAADDIHQMKADATVLNLIGSALERAEIFQLMTEAKLE